MGTPQRLRKPEAFILSVPILSQWTAAADCTYLVQSRDFAAPVGPPNSKILLVLQIFLCV